MSHCSKILLNHVILDEINPLLQCKLQWCQTPVVNFGKVRRAQLAKSTLLTSSLVPLGTFQIF